VILHAAQAASIVICLLLVGITLPREGRAETGAQLLAEQAALEESQAAIGRTLSNHPLVGSDGENLQLHQFRGKPLVISLIYTSCHHVCPTMTKQLSRAVDIGREALGQDSFSVLTIGFDTPSDTPDRMHAFARERGIDTPGWWFASTDSLTIKRLAEELGFTYVPSVRGFDHLTQTTLVGADGTIVDQVYGELLHSPTFVEPLKRLVWGAEANANTLSGWVKGVKLVCTVYDPSTGRYTFDYSIFITLIIGVASLGAVAAFVVKHWRETGRNTRQEHSSGILGRLFRL